MKYLSLFVFTLCLFFQTQAQQTETEKKYAKSFLDADLKEQQQVFMMRYIFTYYSIHEIQDTAAKATRTLQVMKTEIRDTLKPFFNTIAVNAQTLAKPIADLKNKSQVAYLFNSSVSEDEDVKAFKGQVEYNTTSLPYRSYMKIYSNITSVTDASGKNILVDGVDTIRSTWAGYQSGDQFYTSAKFTYDNTNHPSKVTVNGTVTVKVPTKFLVISFIPAEVGKSKIFQEYTFTLEECAAGKVIVSANNYTASSDIEVIPVGPSNVRYRKDQQHFMGGTVFTDNFVLELARKDSKLISDDTLKAVYFDRYLNDMKTRPVKLATIYSSLSKGNIQKIYIVKPIEYYTIKETFSLTSK